MTSARRCQICSLTIPCTRPFPNSIMQYPRSNHQGGFINWFLETQESNWSVTQDQHLLWHLWEQYIVFLSFLFTVLYVTYSLFVISLRVWGIMWHMQLFTSVMYCVAFPWVYGCNCYSQPGFYFVTIESFWHRHRLKIEPSHWLFPLNFHITYIASKMTLSCWDLISPVNTWIHTTSLGGAHFY
jgi:hypothetical protein